LITAFGTSCKSSIIVVASKRDLVTTNTAAKRTHKLVQYMDTTGVGDSLVAWKSDNVSDVEFEEQLKSLQEKLELIPPITMKEMDILSVRVESEAMQLFKAQPTTKEVMVEESYAVNYPTVEYHTESYVETRNVSALDSNMERDPIGTIIAGVLSLGIGTLVQSLWNVTEHEVKTRQVETQVMRSKTEYRSVLKVVPTEIQPMKAFTILLVVLWLTMGAVTSRMVYRQFYILASSAKNYITRKTMRKYSDSYFA
jgi:hypothetical protein